MKQKIIWFVYALFFMFGLFMKNFATTETFHALGQTLDFSSATLLYFFAICFLCCTYGSSSCLAAGKIICPKKGSGGSWCACGYCSVRVVPCGSLLSATRSAPVPVVSGTCL
ncbi:MAG TPA: hypothetical protein PLV73_05195 [Treponemataceae bacterium]|nr:hypothetical protein [Treponemataceae bacterium]